MSTIAVTTAYQQKQISNRRFEWRSFVWYISLMNESKRDGSRCVAPSVGSAIAGRNDSRTLALTMTKMTIVLTITMTTWQRVDIFKKTNILILSQCHVQQIQSKTNNIDRNDEDSLPVPRECGRSRHGSLTHCAKLRLRVWR